MIPTSARVRLTKTGTDTWYANNLGAGGGLTLVSATAFTTASAVNVNSAFSASYLNYKMLLNISAASADAALTSRLRVSGADNSAASYSTTRLLGTGTTASAESPSIAATSWSLIGCDTTNPYWSLSADIFRPFSTAPTQVTASFTGTNGAGTFYVASEAHNHAGSTSFDGISIISTGATITGTLYIFGYSTS